jgi:DNA-binding transcriptional LysR family regulator
MPDMTLSARNALTPDSIALLDAVQRTGSLAAAARELGKVPSAVSYTARQLEDAMDVLLFDRRGKAAQLTAAGQAMLAEGRELLQQIDDAARRVRRIAGGWESRLVITLDQIVRPQPVFELIEQFDAIECGTTLRIESDVLQGPWDALLSGRADLAVGATRDGSSLPGLASRTLGRVEFVYCIAPYHPLAAIREPLSAEQLKPHRAIAIADTSRRLQPMTLGLLPGQTVLTLPTLQAKLMAQLQGLGGGYLPAHFAAPYLQSGRLVAKRVVNERPAVPIALVWRNADKGKALLWWVEKLSHDTARKALLSEQGWLI